MFFNLQFIELELAYLVNLESSSKDAYGKPSDLAVQLSVVVNLENSPSEEPSGPSDKPSGPCDKSNCNTIHNGPNEKPGGPSEEPRGPSKEPSGPSEEPSGLSDKPSDPLHWQHNKRTEIQTLADWIPLQFLQNFVELRFFLLQTSQNSILMGLICAIFDVNSEIFAQMFR